MNATADLLPAAVPPSPIYSGIGGTDRWAGGLVAIGALGVVVTSVLYALAPPIAALPFPTLNVPLAMRDTVAGATWMQAAGTIGVMADIALVAGAWLAAARSSEHRRSREACGWIAVAIATLLFIGVDMLGGQVLPSLGARAGAEHVYEGFRRMFDALWVAGTLTFGMGAWLLAAPGLEGAARRVSWALRVIGVFAFAGVIGHAWGLPMGLVMGLTIGIGSAIFVIVGLRLARGQ